MEDKHKVRENTHTHMEDPSSNRKMSPREFELRLKAMVEERQMRDDELRARIKAREKDARRVEDIVHARCHVHPGRNASLSFLMHVMM